MEPLNKLFLDLEVVFSPDYCVSHDKDEIEYIRKDALIEWAKERYQQTISNVGCYTGHSVWEEVIQYIESL